MVCHELAKRESQNAKHEVRFGKLGGKTLVTVASRQGDTYDERRTLLVGMDEIPVAAERIAEALTSGRSIRDTRNVDNVLAVETPGTKVQRGQMGFDGGIFGMTGIGESSGAAGGVHLGLLYRAENFGISSHGRAGGIGSGDEKLGSTSIDFGARYYFSDGEVSPFAGGGLELAYFNLVRRRGSDDDGSGLAAFAQLGLEMLRSHHAALSTSLRIDVPTFSLGGQYVAPVSLNVGVVFR